MPADFQHGAGVWRKKRPANFGGPDPSLREVEETEFIL
jgi:hypothetical protein